MIYTMLKSSFINIEPKLLKYRDYKNFNFENFKEDLSEVLLILETHMMNLKVPL